MGSEAPTTKAAINRRVTGDFKLGILNLLVTPVGLGLGIKDDLIVSGNGLNLGQLPVSILLPPESTWTGYWVDG